MTEGNAGLSYYLSAAQLNSLFCLCGRIDALPGTDATESHKLSEEMCGLLWKIKAQ